MKKEEVGYVVDTNQDMAKVKVGRHSDCKNCGSCPGNNTLILTVKNPIGAELGQKVSFEVKEHKMLQSVYIVYVQPLLLTFIGAIIGYFLATYIHQSVGIYEVIFGVIFFIISVVYIKIIDKRLTNDMNNIPIITKIIS